MLIVMNKGCTRADEDRVVRLIEEMGFEAHPLAGAERTSIGITGNRHPIDPAPFELLPGVSEAIPVTRPYRLAGRECHPDPTIVRIGSQAIGAGTFAIVAGPCAVESETALVSFAKRLKHMGASMLRGGAFKPRSSPYSFQGLGEEGLKILARAREETGLPVVTEAVDADSLDLVERYADVIQIGARNMQNFSLLRRAGKARIPVFLKRGISASLEDLLMSAEYVLAEGNPEVILCERGIRTFSSHSRFTLDLAVVPAVRSLSHLPIFVDPSHAAGVRDRVPPLARAALAAGADGLMLEVHPDPRRSLSDGPQALLPDTFADLVRDLRALAPLLSRTMEPAA